MPTTAAMITMQLRLPEEAWARYRAQAAAAGKPVSTYLRERLEQQDELAEQLESLRRAVEDLGAHPAAASGQDAPVAETSQGVALESLLLLRILAGSQKAELARKEIERRGIATWR